MVNIPRAHEEDDLTFYCCIGDLLYKLILGMVAHVRVINLSRQLFR